MKEISRNSRGKTCESVHRFGPVSFCRCFLRTLSRTCIALEKYVPVWCHKGLWCLERKSHSIINNLSKKITQYQISLPPKNCNQPKMWRNCGSTWNFIAFFCIWRWTHLKATCRLLLPSQREDRSSTLHHRTHITHNDSDNEPHWLQQRLLGPQAWQAAEPSPAESQTMGHHLPRARAKSVRRWPGSTALAHCRSGPGALAAFCAGLITP